MSMSAYCGRLLRSRPLLLQNAAVTGARSASLTSAINRGIRRSQTIEIGGITRTRYSDKGSSSLGKKSDAVKDSEEREETSGDGEGGRLRFGRAPARLNPELEDTRPRGGFSSASNRGRSFESRLRGTNSSFTRERPSDNKRPQWGSSDPRTKRFGNADRYIDGKQGSGRVRSERSPGSHLGETRFDRRDRDVGRDRRDARGMREVTGRGDSWNTSSGTRWNDGNPRQSATSGRADREERYPSDHSERRSRSEKFEENGEAQQRRPRERKSIPLSIPYTTSASEFLYGTSVVSAALNSTRTLRRKLYKLYIYAGENRTKKFRDVGLERLARRQGVEVIKVWDQEWLRLMDRLSAGRPHNGYILETSPLPRLPALALEAPTVASGKQGFKVVLDHQTKEDAAINGTEGFVELPKIYSPKSSAPRKPLVLLLDGIQDPGNVGGIIRTAAFMGVSSVAVAAHGTAAFSSIVLKAAAGAAESVSLLTVKSPEHFIRDSKAAGWKVYAAVAPPAPVTTRSKNKTKATSEDLEKRPGGPAPVSTYALAEPLAKDPCILMLGSEGEGLKWALRSQADYALYIPALTPVGGPQGHGVDSLNVSVATGILCDAFMRTGAVARPLANQTSQATEGAVQAERSQGEERKEGEEMRLF